MARRPHYLREWRRYRKLSLATVAERIGITHGTLSRIERGEYPYNQRHLEALAEVFETDPASLIGRDPRDPEGIFEIWLRLTPARKRQILAIIKALNETDSR
jgi:transcriptional regulator with XRE-family HTH domain